MPKKSVTLAQKMQTNRKNKWRSLMCYKLEGNWRGGWAFDIHTLSSQYLGKDEYGHNRFDNEYSDMGELVHQLKCELRAK